MKTLMIMMVAFAGCMAAVATENRWTHAEEYGALTIAERPTPGLFIPKGEDAVKPAAEHRQAEFSFIRENSEKFICTHAIKEPTMRAKREMHWRLMTTVRSHSGAMTEVYRVPEVVQME